MLLRFAKTTHVDHQVEAATFTAREGQHTEEKASIHKMVEPETAAAEQEPLPPPKPAKPTALALALEPGGEGALATTDEDCEALAATRAQK